MNCRAGVSDSGPASFFHQSKGLMKYSLIGLVITTMSLIPSSQVSAGGDQEYPSEIVFRFVAACAMTIEQKSGPYNDDLPIEICSCILDKTREKMSFVEFHSKPELTKESVQEHTARCAASLWRFRKSM